MKSFFATLVCLVAFTTSAHAASTQQAGDYVQALGDKALAVISNKALAKDKKQKTLENIFAENVDIPWVGRFVMGHFWRTATDEQKKRYLKEYEQFLVQTYASRFTEYTSGTFKITGTRDDGDGEFLVSMEMTTGEPNSEPVFVDYRVREASGKNKFAVFDIIVEGVSMITTQRSEFSSVITNHNVDYLIAQMASKAITAPVLAPKKG